MFVETAAALSYALLAGAAGVGQITGELRFPSCNQTAPGLEVCAESASGDAICTSDFTIADGVLSYAIDVTPGRYFVFARTPMIDHRAYYSQAVLCGMEASCDDHQPIEVEVVAGGIRAGVHPADWARDVGSAPIARALTN